MINKYSEARIAYAYLAYTWVCFGPCKKNGFCFFHLHFSTCIPQLHEMIELPHPITAAINIVVTMHHKENVTEEE